MMPSIAISVWRGADIGNDVFRERYLEGLKTATSKVQGLVRCEAFVLNRDVRESLGSIGNGTPTHDLWAMLVFEDERARTLFDEGGRLDSLKDPELAAWTTAAAARYANALDSGIRGKDERPSAHRTLAAPLTNTRPQDANHDHTTAYTVFGTVYRHPTLSHAEFLDHYSRVHWHYVPDLPAIQRYDVYLTEDANAGNTTVPGTPPIPDSYILMTFPSKDDCVAALATPVGEAAIADWKGFLWWVDFEEVDAGTIIG